MPYDPDKHHRRSIRLQKYDYSSVGRYFLTLCTEHRIPFFGRITGETMTLNDAGEMVLSWLTKLPEKYPNVHCDEHVIMPNHFHGILSISGLPVAERGENMVSPLQNRRRGLGQYVSWFKRMTTAYIRGVEQLDWKPFPGKLWQRNYWEHIVRDDDELNRIRKYIRNNPAKWETDDLYLNKYTNDSMKSPRLIRTGETMFSPLNKELP